MPIKIRSLWTLTQIWMKHISNWKSQESQQSSLFWRIISGKRRLEPFRKPKVPLVVQVVGMAVCLIRTLIRIQKKLKKERKKKWRVIRKRRRSTVMIIQVHRWMIWSKIWQELNLEIMVKRLKSVLKMKSMQEIQKEKCHLFINLLLVMDVASLQLLERDTSAYNVLTMIYVKIVWQKESIITTSFLLLISLNRHKESKKWMMESQLR